MWWNPENFSQKIDNLRMRGAIIKEIRRFFDNQGFDEVETPILQTSATMEIHTHSFSTDLRNVALETERTMHLHCSPEFAMKKLMVAGCEKIYQICHVFRNGEDTARHSPEFTMIEWYRTNADYNDIMDDCVELLRACATAANIKEFKYKNLSCNPFEEWEKLTVCEAFERYANIDLAQFLNDKDGLRQAIQEFDLHTAEDDEWDDLFFRVMDEYIEPKLGIGRPTFLCEYPISMASLSKPKADDPRFAERFELYICGLELANAFSELTDADEQERRYHEDMEERMRIYGDKHPLDEDFIAALKHGMSPSGGIALGVDRLVMLACGVDDIADVLWVEV